MLPFDPRENNRRPKFQGDLGPILELNKKNSERNLQISCNSLPWLSSKENFDFQNLSNAYLIMRIHHFQKR